MSIVGSNERTSTARLLLDPTQAHFRISEKPTNQSMAVADARRT